MYANNANLQPVGQDFKRSPVIEQMLRSTTTDTGLNGEFDIISMYSPRQRLKITNHSEFWRQLCEASALSFDEESGAFPLAQKQRDVCPLIIDIKPMLVGEECAPWLTGFLESICHAFQEAIRATFQLDPNNAAQLLAAVSTSAPWTEKNGNDVITHSHARIYFPYCVSAIDIQRRLVFPRAMEILKELSVSKYINGQQVNRTDFISLAGDKPLTFYGHTEQEGQEPLMFSGIWGYVNRVKMSFDSDVYQTQTAPLNTIFFPDYHSIFTEKQQSLNVLQQYRDGDGNIDITFWLPLFLSNDYYTRPTPLNENSPLNRGATGTDAQNYMLNALSGTPRSNGQNASPGASPNASPASSPGQRNVADERPIEIAQRFMHMLSKDRFMKKIYWTKIGKVLYNISDGTQRGLDMWIQKTVYIIQNLEPGTEIPSFLQGDITNICTSLYHTFFNNWYTLNTLASFASQDNEEAYNAWHMDWCLPSLAKASTSVENDIAQALYRTYWLNFSCSSFSKRRWYYFHRHTWVESDHGVELRKLISSDFRNRFERLCTDMCEAAERTSNEEEKAGLRAEIKKINALIINLGRTSVKNNVMSEVAEFFYNANFNKYLDSDGETYALLNGVFEATDTGITFRQGIPEDYKCRCAPTRYFADLTWEHPMVVEAMNWAHQMYPDDELFEYMMKYEASVFRGGNIDKKVGMRIGEGGNGKSMWVKAEECIHGPYLVKLPVSFLTKEQFDANSPTPALARTKGTRLVIVQEASKKARFSDEAFKLYSGNDSFFGRGLNMDGDDIRPLFKIVLVANNLPMFVHVDGAIQDRAVVLPHLANFVYDAPADPAEQMRQRKFKRNDNFEQRIPLLSPYLLWAFIQYYPLYARDGLRQVPTIVKQYTDQYWKDIDPVFQWQGEEVQKVTVTAVDGSEIADERHHLTLNDCYANYREWYRFAFPQTRLPDRNSLREQLVSKWGHMRAGGWYGWKFVRNPTDVRNVIPSARNPVKRMVGDEGNYNTGNGNSMTPQDYIMMQQQAQQQAQQMAQQQAVQYDQTGQQCVQANQQQVQFVNQQYAGQQGQQYVGQQYVQQYTGQQYTGQPMMQDAQFEMQGCSSTGGMNTGMNTGMNATMPANMDQTAIYQAKKALNPNLSIVDLPPPDVVGKLDASKLYGSPDVNVVSNPFDFVNQIASRMGSIATV